jgi:hypothetical protein
MVELIRHREMDPIFHCRACQELAEFVDGYCPAGQRALSASVVAVCSIEDALTWRVGDCPEAANPSGPLQRVAYTGPEPLAYHHQYWQVIARLWCLWKELDLTCTGPVRSEAAWRAATAQAAQRWWRSGVCLSQTGPGTEVLLAPEYLQVLSLLSQPFVAE